MWYNVPVMKPQAETLRFAQSIVSGDTKLAPSSLQRDEMADMFELVVNLGVHVANPITNEMPLAHARTECIRAAELYIAFSAGYRAMEETL